MAPVSDLMIFLLGGICLALLAWLLPTVISLRVITCFLALLTFIALLRLLPQLHPYAVILLASGLAFQTSRMIVVRQDRFCRLVQRTSVWLIAIVVMIAIVITVTRQISERRAVAQLPTAANGAPNVLLIVLDTVPATSLSLYGYQRRTSPQLEQVARNGVVFDNAISTAPWTLPSHASMFTGRLPNELNVSWTKPLDESYPTLAEKLRDHGYETAGLAGNLVYCSSTHGLNRGMVRYRDFPVTLGQTFISSTLGQAISEKRWFQRITRYHDDLNRKNAECISQEFLSWLHVPLLVIFPSHVPAGGHIQQTVSLRDLPATLVDLIGLDQSTNFPGKTMSRYWTNSVNDGQAAEELVYSEVKPGFHLEKWCPTAQGHGYMKSLIRGNYHFISNGDGREELYDWKSDPDEKNDLAHSEGSRPVLEEFKLTLNTTFHSK